MRAISTSPMVQGFKETTIYQKPTDVTESDCRVFVLENGAIGMECGGRIAVHTIERWVELSFGDLPRHAR